MTDSRSPEVAAFADGIEAASGGLIRPGMDYGWTSQLESQCQPWELSHRLGTGLDLDCVGIEPATVFAWASSLSCVEVAVQLETAVHVTLVEGAQIDLAGCPKPKPKKKAADEVTE